MFKLPWVPVKAVRGHGMLIEGTHVGLYNMLSYHSSRNKHVSHWAVYYLILTGAEWEKIKSQVYAPHAEFHVSYVERVQPSEATVTRLYLTAREAIHGTEDLVWIGCYTPWRDKPYEHVEVQTIVIDFFAWIKKCLES